MTSLVAQMVKHLPIMWETQVQSLGREDLLEKGMAAHSSIFFSPPLPRPRKKGAQRNVDSFPVAQRVKPLPTRRETQVRSLGREVPLEKEMATHFSILAWRLPMNRDILAGYSPSGRKESDITE